MAKPSFEDVYAEYLRSDDKIIEIDGKKYYKFIDKFNMGNWGKIIVYIPFKTISIPSDEVECIDEKGNRFHMKLIRIHYRFSDGIPDWYLETYSCEISDLEYERLGSYFSFI